MSRFRWASCAVCGLDGIHVDTAAGEVIAEGVVVATVDDGTRTLMADDRGRLTCDPCATLLVLSDRVGLEPTRVVYPSGTFRLTRRGREEIARLRAEPCPHGRDPSCLPCSLATGEAPAVEDAGS